MLTRFKTLFVLLAALSSLELGATGPNGTPSTQHQRSQARTQYSRIRTAYDAPRTGPQAGHTPPQTTAALNSMATSLHASLPTRSRGYSTTGVSQIAETGQLIASSSNSGAMPREIREHIEVANTMTHMGNPNAQPMIAAPNVVQAHAEGAAEHFAEAHGGLTIARQGANRPACLMCERRQDSQGISREPGYTTGAPTRLWASPDVDPARAAQENAAHQTAWQNR